MQNEKINFSTMFSKFTENWWIYCAEIYKSYLHSHFLFTHVIGNIVSYATFVHKFTNCKCMVVFSLQQANWKYYN